MVICLFSEEDGEDNDIIIEELDYRSDDEIEEDSESKSEELDSDTDHLVDMIGKCKSDTNEMLLEAVEGDSVKFNPIFTADLYEAIVAICRLSYSVSTEIRHKKLSAEQDEIQKDYVSRLYNLGFEKYETVLGKTGTANQTNDATCIICKHQSKNIILVAFHGSLFKRLTDIFHKSNDWGSNFKFKSVKASEVNLTDLPPALSLHEGYARNYQSVQQVLNEHLKTAISNLTNKDDPVWLFFTGHSKGAAMATLAAAGMKTFFNKTIETENRTINVAVLAFSSPRVFYGKTAQRWANATLGMNNVLRIHVKGDPVTSVPPYKIGYRHVGVPFMDNVDDVRKKEKTTALSYVIALHYGGKSKDGTFFNSEIVMRYEEMASARKRAVDKTKHSSENGCLESCQSAKDMMK